MRNVNRLHDLSSGYSLVWQLPLILNNKKMRTILVGTDNSDVSHNALQFAVDLAADKSMEVHLFTSYEMVISSAYDVAFTSPTSIDIENGIKQHHQRLIEDIKAKHPTLHINSSVSMGNASDMLLECGKQIKADLIILGNSGRGAVSKFLLGSTVASVIHENIFPTLIIPQGASYKGFGKTVFAFDHAFYTEQKMKPLIEFLHFFKSRLLIVNVMKELKKLKTEDAISGLSLEGMLYDIEHTFHYPSDSSTTKKLSDFTFEFEADCLAMIPHHHSILNRLFGMNHTDEILHNLNIPLLTIPE
jgi:nucleotide-binding universal stress UspA family protein